MKKISLVAIMLSLLAACDSKQDNYKLPVLGRTQLVEKITEGKISYDTLQHTIRPFSFTNQDGQTITNETLDGKVYVADFFFTSCPTICPVMKKEMLRVYQKYESNPQVAILSHTIDPKHDTVELLKDYAERLGVKSSTWHFVTGNQDEIYTISESSYMVTAGEDYTAPGGYIHSGAFLLIDKRRRVRGVYDGTEKNQVDILISDITRLLKEE